MIATWMLYGTVIAILVGLGALALERGARVLGRAGRWCWVGATVITLALPLVAWLAPQRPAPTRNPSPTPGAVIQGARLAPTRVPTRSVLIVSPFNWSGLDRPLIYAWGLLSLLLIGWFAAGSWRLRRRRRSWRQEGDLLVSADVGPAVVGFFRCRVVIPEWSLELGAEQRELLLAHEAEHLKAHDSRLLVLAAAVLALAPWNLGLWWQFRRLRLAIELDCDQRVLRRRPDPATYGRLLLEVGSRATRTLVLVAAFHEPMSSLERRIRALTALRPRRPTLWAFATVLASGAAIFAACEAPRPTAPAAKKESFSFQTREEQGKITSTFIADSVRHYFGAGATQGPVYLWFIVSPDGHVVRYGTTPRKPDDNTIRSQAADSVVPGFGFRKMQSVTLVGENAISPGSQPVFWAVLRDPNRLFQPSADASVLGQVPWVVEAMQEYHPDLLTATSGSSREVWFIADAGHNVYQTKVVTPRSVAGTALRPIHDLNDVFPGLWGGVITSITPAATRGWARDSVNVVWVTLQSTHPVRGRGMVESSGGHSDTVQASDQQWLWSSEGNRTSLLLPSRGEMMEKGTVVVADKYPQYLHATANPAVTIWVVEDKGGQISTHVSKAYTRLGDAEMAAELPAYRQFRPGEWLSWLPLSDQRTDVRIVWMHANR